MITVIKKIQASTPTDIQYRYNSVRAADMSVAALNVQALSSQVDSEWLSMFLLFISGEIQSDSNNIVLLPFAAYQGQTIVF